MEEISNIKFSTIKIEFDDDRYVLVWEVITNKSKYWLRKNFGEDTLFEKGKAYWDMHDSFVGLEAPHELMESAISRVYNGLKPLHNPPLSRDALIDNLLSMSQSMVFYDTPDK